MLDPTTNSFFLSLRIMTAAIKHFFVNHDFSAQTTYELDLREGDVIRCVDQPITNQQDTWYSAEIDGRWGLVPTTYVTEYKQQEKRPFLMEGWLTKSTPSSPPKKRYFYLFRDTLYYTEHSADVYFF